jgi:hypothetical protein
MKNNLSDLITAEYAKTTTQPISSTASTVASVLIVAVVAIALVYGLIAIGGLLVKVVAWCLPSATGSVPSTAATYAPILASSEELEIYDTPLEEVKASLRRSLAETKSGQRIPLAQMWEGVDELVDYTKEEVSK